jgi:hypothetical protein
VELVCLRQQVGAVLVECRNSFTCRNGLVESRRLAIPLYL